jgi:hypothetical protein
MQSSNVSAAVDPRASTIKGTSQRRDLVLTRLVSELDSLLLELDGAFLCSSCIEWHILRARLMFIRLQDNRATRLRLRLVNPDLC